MAVRRTTNSVVGTSASAQSIPDLPHIGSELVQLPGMLEYEQTMQQWWDQFRQNFVETQIDSSGKIREVSAVAADGITTLTARVSVIESTYVDAAAAYAQAESAITAELTGPSGSIYASVDAVSSALATATGYLEGKYTLTVSAGDVVTGMNITSASGGGTNVSQVAFQTDKFQIYNGTTGVDVFSVSGSTIQLKASVTVLGTITLGQVSGTGSLAAQSSADWSTQVGGSGKPSDNADVTLAAINGGLTITSGGLILDGTPSIQSSDYVAGSAGWAIMGDGSVEFNDGYFRGTLASGRIAGATIFTKGTDGEGGQCRLEPATGTWLWNIDVYSDDHLRIFADGMGAPSPGVLDIQPNVEVVGYLKVGGSLKFGTYTASPLINNYDLSTIASGYVTAYDQSGNPMNLLVA